MKHIKKYTYIINPKNVNFIATQNKYINTFKGKIKKNSKVCLWGENIACKLKFSQDKEIIYNAKNK